VKHILLFILSSGGGGIVVAREMHSRRVSQVYFLEGDPFCQGLNAEGGIWVNGQINHKFGLKGDNDAWEWNY